MDARFLLSSPNAAGLPNDDDPEVAIAGRSNCGKSSLINALTGRKGLARTSSTPGRTRELVLFSFSLAGANVRLVDLPGYGYAKVSRAERALWGEVVPRYVESRQQLKLMLLLCDIRRSPAEEEHDLVAWCAARGLACRLVLTKGDKLNKSQRFAAAAKARRELGTPDDVLVISSLKKEGFDPLRDLIRHALLGDA